MIKYMRVRQWGIIYTEDWVTSFNKGGSWVSIVCTTKRFTGAFIISVEALFQPASLTWSKSNHAEIRLSQKTTQEDIIWRKTGRGMRRLRIFNIFHKHFLCRLLNYDSKGRVEVEVKTTVKLDIKPGLLTKTLLLYINYKYIYICAVYAYNTQMYIYDIKFVWTKLQPLQHRYYSNKRIITDILISTRNWLGVPRSRVCTEKSVQRSPDLSEADFTVTLCQEWGSGL